MAAASVTNSPQHWLEGALGAAGQDAIPPHAVSGSRATVNVMVSLLDALVDLGLIIDNTTA